MRKVDLLALLLRALEDCRQVLAGTSMALVGPWEIRSSIVFWPVAHIVPVEAESGS